MLDIILSNDSYLFLMTFRRGYKFSFSCLVTFALQFKGSNWCMSASLWFMVHVYLEELRLRM